MTERVTPLSHPDALNAAFPFADIVPQVYIDTYRKAFSVLPASLQQHFCTRLFIDSPMENNAAENMAGRLFANAVKEGKWTNFSTEDFIVVASEAVNRTSPPSYHMYSEYEKSIRLLESRGMIKEIPARQTSTFRPPEFEPTEQFVKLVQKGIAAIGDVVLSQLTQKIEQFT